jgi:hypothetical protein
VRKRRWKKADPAESKPASPARAAPARIVAAEKISPLLSTAPAPLGDLVRAGQLKPLTAAAIMPWPGIVVEQLHLSPAMPFNEFARRQAALKRLAQKKP